MSRSGYSDDCDGWDLIRWRGAVTSAINGKRGQAFLRELIAALDAMPVKRLITEELEQDGQYCALGALGAARGLLMAGIDTYDRETVAKAFGIAPALAAEIEFQNDECATQDYIYGTVEICGPMRPHYPDYSEHTRHINTPNTKAEETRWGLMRHWAETQLRPAAPANAIGGRL